MESPDAHSPCPTCGNSNTALPTPEVEAIDDGAIPENETTLAIAKAAQVQAEVSRLQAETILLLLQPKRNVVTHHGQPRIDPTTPALSIPRDVPAGMLISETAGSISVAEWEALGEARLRELDTALEKIVATAMIVNIPWESVGVFIHTELAAVGFVFNGLGNNNDFDAIAEWQVAQNATLSNLVRVRAAADSARLTLINHQWMGDMLRIAVRLIELRGL